MIFDYEALKSKVKERKEDFNDFIRFLETNTTWLSAPASTKHHLNEEGGGAIETFYRCNKYFTPIKGIAGT